MYEFWKREDEQKLIEIVDSSPTKTGGFAEAAEVFGKSIASVSRKYYYLKNKMGKVCPICKRTHDPNQIPLKEIIEYFNINVEEVIRLAKEIEKEGLLNE